MYGIRVNNGKYYGPYSDLELLLTDFPRIVDIQELQFDDGPDPDSPDKNKEWDMKHRHLYHKCLKTKYDNVIDYCYVTKDLMVEMFRKTGKYEPSVKFEWFQFETLENNKKEEQKEQLMSFLERLNVIMNRVKEVDERSSIAEERYLAEEALAEKEYLEEMKRLDEEAEAAELEYQQEDDELMEQLAGFRAQLAEQRPTWREEMARAAIKTHIQWNVEHGKFKK